MELIIAPVRCYYEHLITCQLFTEAACFILLASLASWLGGTQRGDCAVCTDFPTMRCHTLPTTGTNPSHNFKLVTLAKPDPHI